MEKSASDEEKDKEFWEWNKRPAIQAKLYPHRDPNKVRREVDRLISSRLLGTSNIRPIHPTKPLTRPRLFSSIDVSFCPPASSDNE